MQGRQPLAQPRCPRSSVRTTAFKPLFGRFLHTYTHTCTRVALCRDHGGHIYDDRDDLGNYSWVALTGKYDSGNILDADDELEKTGTYALCFARWNGEESCTTWVPSPENYTFMPDVQIHIRHSPPSMQLALEPTRTHTHCSHVARPV